MEILSEGYLARKEAEEATRRRKEGIKEERKSRRGGGAIKASTRITVTSRTLTLDLNLFLECKGPKGRVGEIELPHDHEVIQRSMTLVYDTEEHDSCL